MADVQNNKTVFMFSGQGSQYYRMGFVLYEQRSIFKRYMQSMDSIVQELCGCSVVDELYHQGRARSESFARTLFTHPAIFMVEYALAQTLIESGIEPDLTLGASLGTFAAAAVSGCLTMEEALRTVILQAQLLEKFCAKGAMVAILAQQHVFNEQALSGISEIASYNFASHFVVSAKHDRAGEVEGFLRQRQLPFQRLQVSFAFHSQWIDEARIPFEAAINRRPSRPALIPMVCCAESRILDALPVGHQWAVARKPIRFQQTIASLEEGGSYHYIDVGPAGTLATFLKYSLDPSSESTKWPIMTPFGRELANIEAVVRERK